MAIKKKRITSARRFFALPEKINLKIVIISVVALVLIITFISGSRGTIRLFRDMHQKQNLEKEINELETTKTELDSIKNRLENDPTYIEKIAREEYNMKKEGEKVIKVESDSK
jgi:cell division protein FtsB